MYLTVRAGAAFAAATRKEESDSTSLESARCTRATTAWEIPTGKSSGNLAHGRGYISLAERRRRIIIAFASATPRIVATLPIRDRTESKYTRGVTERRDARDYDATDDVRRSFHSDLLE